MKTQSSEFAGFVKPPGCVSASHGLHIGQHCHALRETLRPRLRTRQGYTLVEMLIASVLVAALMSVVWGMMSMYNSYLTAGQTQAVEQQLVRSVLQLLEDDLQSVAIADTNPVITPSYEMSEGTTSETQFTELSAGSSPLDQTLEDIPDLLEPSVFAGISSSGASAPSTRFSLIGNSVSVRLSVEKRLPDAQQTGSEMGAVSPSSAAGDGNLGQANAPTEPSPGMAVPAAEGVAPDVKEFQTVIWQFQKPSFASSESQSLRAGLYRIQTDSRSLQTAMNQQETLLEDQSPDDQSSVDRTTLEALLNPSLETMRPESGTDGLSSIEDSPKVAPQFDVIPEVVSCRFEYFNGSSWAFSWNSDQQQSLPQAIRCRLTLVTPATLEKLSRLMGAQNSLDSPLDEALNQSVPTPPSADVGTQMTDTEVGEDPLKSIVSRSVEKIVMLQPISGPMPEPGPPRDAADGQPRGMSDVVPSFSGAIP